MKLKLYLVSIILLSSPGVFLQQHLEDPVFKSCADYSKTGANINEVYHCCYSTIANPNLGNPYPAVETSYSKILAANISTYTAEHQYSKIIRVQNTDSNPFIFLSNPANCNNSIPFKDQNEQQVKAGIIDPEVRTVCEIVNKADCDNCGIDALKDAVFIINILKGIVETKDSQFVV